MDELFDFVSVGSSLDTSSNIVSEETSENINNNEEEVTINENISNSDNQDIVSTDLNTEPVSEEKALETNEQEVEKTEEDSTDTSNVQTVKEYLEFMKAANILYLPEDYELDESNPEDSLLKAIEDSKAEMQKNLVQEIWNSLPEDFQYFLDYGLRGGTDLESAYNLIKNSDLSLDSVNLENENHQIELVKKYLKETTKFNDDKIDRTIKVYQNNKILESQAEEALDELKKIGEIKKQEFLENQAKQTENQKIQLQKAYNSFTETVKELSVNENRKQQIIDSIWGQGNYDGKSQSRFSYINSQISNNPKHLAQLANLYLDYDPNTGFPEYKNNSNKQQKDATINLRNKLNTLLNNSMATKSKQIKDNNSNLEDIGNIVSNLNIIN